MQPYFFPYIGYWQLITNSDEFVFFDIVQYNKRSWMNRNRILHNDNIHEFQYITVPIIKHTKGTLIKNVIINSNERWREKILGQLTVYKNLKAPFYNEMIELIERIFNVNHENLLSLLIESIKIICDYLDIKFKYKIASDIDLRGTNIQDPDDWALEISKKLKATNYLNPYGGYEIFDENKYNINNVDIKFLKSNLTSYQQSWKEPFQEGLSIIDVMMFNCKDTVKNLLENDFKLYTKQELQALSNA